MAGDFQRLSCVRQTRTVRRRTALVVAKKPFKFVSERLIHPIPKGSFGVVWTVMEAVSGGNPSGRNRTRDAISKHAVRIVRESLHNGYIMVGFCIMVGFYIIRFVTVRQDIVRTDQTRYSIVWYGTVHTTTNKDRKHEA